MPRRPFAEQLLIRANMIAAFGGRQDGAAHVRRRDHPATSAPAAECVTVEGGEIVYNRFIFDRLPLEEFRRRQTSDGM